MKRRHVPKVSICIPAYQQIEFLRMTLTSIQKQFFSDYEVLVTDDSPDDSVELLVAEFSFDGKLSYFRNPSPLGSPENWNECIRRSNGEYIKIMHHDDHFTDEHSLERFVALLDANPDSDFGFSATRVDDMATGRSRIHCPSKQDLMRLQKRPQTLFCGNVVGAPSATIYRRKVSAEYDITMRWLVDLDFYIRVLLCNSTFAFSPEPLISTPTNAAHQVTETCRDNAKIELFEYSRLFSKLGTACHSDEEIAGTWRRLFAKYRIRKLADFQRFGVDCPKEEVYFESLLRRPVRRWQQIVRSPRHELMRLLYRVYPHVPSNIRTPIRWLKNRLVSRSRR